MKTVWVVVDLDCKTRILAIFSNERDAKEFAKDVYGDCFERRVHNGQPSNKGYNK